MKFAFLVILIFGLLSSTIAKGQGRKNIDSLAVLILDKMSGVIGDMTSCTFSLTTATDVLDPEYGSIKRFADYNVCLSGRDKMLVNARSHKGHVRYLFRAGEMAFYSFDENNYGIIQAPKTTIQAIDSLSINYGIEFPAADFFYPAFTDDLISSMDAIRYMGMDNIEGAEYFHIMASSQEQSIQLWVSNDIYFLPAKLVITYRKEENMPQYFASFSAWEINPDLPKGLFEFMPPPGASQVRILAKNER